MEIVIALGARVGGQVTNWVRRAGGQLSLMELEELYSEQYHCNPVILSGDQAQEAYEKEGATLFKLKDAVISEIRPH